jgi:hypothetical protein
VSPRGATANQNKRPRVEEDGRVPDGRVPDGRVPDGRVPDGRVPASAGPRPVCPRMDTPSSSHGHGTQFLNGRRADPRMPNELGHGSGQRGNRQQQYNGSSHYADI